MVEIPPSFKSITSAIRRAEEADRGADRDSALLAYACRFSAVSKATKLATNSKEETTFIMAQLDSLERAKKTHNVNEADCVQVVRNNIATVFDKADEIDRAGAADKSTAKLFYAAVTFFDVLEFYGPLDAETNEKRKYCKWKAAEILNACNSGVKPTPGGYGEMASFSSTPAEQSTLTNLSLSHSQSQTQLVSPPPSAPYPSFPSFPTQPSQPTQPAYTPQYTQPPTPQMAFQPLPALTQPAYAMPVSSFQSVVSPGASRAPPLNNADPRVKDAMEIVSFAMAALKHNELQLARDRLQEALRRLG